MVTSLGGTTTEALLQLEKEGLCSVPVEAVAAAYRKAQSLCEFSEVASSFEDTLQGTP